ncbi:hypothetical protein BKA82DRAFT_35555 [Pisolithus tinctorius]|uniref:Uncharacterized protein n=1 Tax=Pisolithus tinctorius Marx 270 TaxID=870435 RepID=A0A0C3NEM3_PISTI|nr:hypothetical protein BKA82DRAFT_35555 [Pisolithus tinctorius]KIN93953.1 hypothetical protein M404DRAFT_35555 [Pisolithus tinctorius Marx 270]
MDSGVRLLYIDVAGVGDDAAISYEFVHQEYMLKHVTVQNDVSERTVYPASSLLVCHASSVREFVEQYPFLGLKVLKSIADHHNVVLHDRLRRQLCVDALRGHTCLVTCTSLLYVFRQLKHARRGKCLAPVLQAATSLESSVAGVRAARRSIAQARREPTMTTAAGEAQIYPPIRSLSKKLDFVREWQDRMLLQKLVEDVCTVCAQMCPCGELSDIHPSTEILSILRNNWLPADCRPKTYDVIVTMRTADPPHHRRLLIRPAEAKPTPTDRTIDTLSTIPRSNKHYFVT